MTIDFRPLNLELRSPYVNFSSQFTGTLYAVLSIILLQIQNTCSKDLDFNLFFKF